MTEKERLMYQVMGNISISDVPIVFKGAMVTKLILAESGYGALERQTKDIDANWIDSPPAMDDLVGAINRSLGDMRSEFYAVAFREYEEKKSAGISICAKDTGSEIILMDISMKPVHGSRAYQYGEISVKGVLANEILSDKLTVLSKKLIFRRAKDIVDVYALAHCVKVHTTEILDMFRKHPDREVGAFDEFYNRRKDVAHAYDRLKGVERKPPFDEVHSYLSKFVRPFARRDKAPQVWDSGSQAWKEARQREFGKPSVIAEIRAAEAERRYTAPPKKKTLKDEPEI